jgi:hypothetical protein
MNKFIKNTLYFSLSLLIFYGLIQTIFLITGFLKVTNLQYQAKYMRVMEHLLQIFQKKKGYLFHLTQFQKM